MVQYILEQSELFVRIILAAFCGALIGYERMHRGKGAGIRTHLVVAAASALMMIISKYGFSDISKIVVGNVAEYRLDPSRLAAQIVSGVGFLGAGMIYLHGRTPQGLTTAAGIWATSGIGMAIGAGMYVMGLLTTIFIYISQLVLHQNLKFLKSTKEENIVVVINDDPDGIFRVKELLEENQIQIEKLSLKRLDNSTIKVKCDVMVSQDFDSLNFCELISKNDYIREISMV